LAPFFPRKKIKFSEFFADGTHLFFYAVMRMALSASLLKEAGLKMR